MNDKRRTQIIALVVCVGIIVFMALRPPPAPPAPLASATPAAPTAPPVERVTALYAREPIAALTSFTDMTKIRQYFVQRTNVPAQFLPGNGVAASYPEMMQRVSLVGIERNEPIVLARFARIDELARASSRIPGGRRAITVPVESQHAAGGFVKQGDLVDVTAEYSNESGSAMRPVLSGVRVFAVNAELEASRSVTPTAPAPGDPSPRAPGQSPVKAASIRQVTFVVTPQEAERLSMAAESGKLYLLLRNSDASGPASLEPIDFDSVLNDASSGPPPAKSAIELLQGSARTQVLVTPSARPGK